MTTKSYTDLPQSKKLAEILPLESADMHYATWTILDGEFIVSPNQGSTIKSMQEDYGNQIIPCWSLAPLLKIIPKKIKGFNVLRIDIDEKYFSLWYDEVGYGVNTELPYITMEYPVDACVAMIEKLYKLKLI